MLVDWEFLSKSDIVHIAGNCCCCLWIAATQIDQIVTCVWIMEKKMPLVYPPWHEEFHHHYKLDTIQDLLCKLVKRSLMHLVKISIVAILDQSDPLTVFHSLHNWMTWPKYDYVLRVGKMAGDYLKWCYPPVSLW